MTLIAISTREDRAEVLTDSLAATANSRHTVLMRGHKAHPLLHCDAVAVSTGQHAAAVRWASHVSTLAQRGLTVDDIIPAADAKQCQPGGGWGSIFYLIGWSPSAGRFVAFAWAVFTDWQPVDVSGLHVQPHPFGVARTDDLLDRWTAWGQGMGQGLGNLTLPDGPTRSAPTTADEWADLVQAVRQTRSVAPSDGRLRAIIGGQVTRLTLTRGDLATDPIVTLDDPTPAPLSESFEAMFTYTSHPSFQLAPCYKCDSGTPLVECCLRVMAGAPCMCGSGVLFAECCRVAVGEDHRLDEYVAALRAGGTPVAVPVSELRGVSQACPQCGSLDALRHYSTTDKGTLCSVGLCQRCHHFWAPPPLPAVDDRPARTPLSGHAVQCDA